MMGSDFPKRIQDLVPRMHVALSKRPRDASEAARRESILAKFYSLVRAADALDAELGEKAS